MVIQQTMLNFRGVRFEKNPEDVIDVEREDDIQTDDTKEHSSDPDESDEETHSINGDVNHDGDDENDDVSSDADAKDDVKKENLDNKDTETTNEKNADKKDGVITGFFRKLSNKKSTDAKPDTDANETADIVELELNNETTEKESKDSDKDASEVEEKKKVSFFQKIGFKKKSAEILSTNEDKKEEDESSNARYKNVCK